MGKFERLFSLITDARLRESTSTRAAEKNLVIASESDKSRVINAAAFRRLQQKAQVFSLETNASVIPPFLIELMGRKSKALLLFKNRWTTIY